MTLIFIPPKMPKASFGTKVGLLFMVISLVAFILVIWLEKTNNKVWATVPGVAFGLIALYLVIKENRMLRKKLMFTDRNL